MSSFSARASFSPSSRQVLGPPSRRLIALFVLPSTLFFACGSQSDIDSVASEGDSSEGPNTPGDSTGDVSDDSPGADDDESSDLIEDEGSEADDSTDQPVSMDTECARDTYVAERAGANLYLLLDISGSMLSPIAVESTVTQWDAVRGAVANFIESSDSSGFDLALNYYPILSERTNCSARGECQGNVICLAGVCDLRFAFADLVVPCASSAECGLVLTIDGVDYRETCFLPGRCSNDEFEPCLLDEQCDAGGSCMVSDQGLCPGETSCQAERYSEPSVARSTLPERATEMVQSLMSHEPDPFAITPTHVALEGAYTRVREWTQQEPDTRSILILATDGAPIGCTDASSRDEDIQLATERSYEQIEAAQVNGIDTFVIGVVPDLSGFTEEERAILEPDFEALRNQLSRMAELGGTGDSFNVSVNDTVSESFADALEVIRSEVLPCEYRIPQAADEVMFDRLNVEVTIDGASEVVPRVESESGCVSGEDSWYYNVDATTQSPTGVVLCPETCSRWNEQTGVSLDIVLGCETVDRVR